MISFTTASLPNTFSHHYNLLGCVPVHIIHWDTTTGWLTHNTACRRMNAGNAVGCLSRLRCRLYQSKSAVCHVLFQKPNMAMGHSSYIHLLCTVYAYFVGGWGGFLFHYLLICFVFHVLVLLEAGFPLSVCLSFLVWIGSWELSRLLILSQFVWAWWMYFTCS